MNAMDSARQVAERLEKAWNSTDGAGIGEQFTPDADFVAIRGDLHSGRSAIAEGHQQILDTIYAGSTIRYEVVQARQLDDRIIVAHVRDTMSAPSGPLTGQHAGLATVVLTGDGQDWRIAAFHNTLVAKDMATAATLPRSTAG